MTIGHTPGNGELEKVDRKVVDGLEGVSNSLAYRVHKIERHLFSAELWFETATTPDGEVHVADRIGDGAGAFQIDAGNDDWGSWVQVLGSDDTPVETGEQYFDIHDIVLEVAERAETYFIQIGWGDDSADIIPNGTYTELVATSLLDAAGDPQGATPLSLKMYRLTAGTEVWARCKCPGQNTATIDIYVGIHEYEG